MSPTPSTEGHPKHMTISQLAAMLDRSRQLIHRLASTDPAFPKPTMEPGSTRPRYDRDAVAAYWAEREANLQQGRRTDLERQKEEAKRGGEQHDGDHPDEGA